MVRKTQHAAKQPHIFPREGLRDCQFAESEIRKEMVNRAGQRPWASQDPNRKQGTLRRTDGREFMWAEPGKSMRGWADPQTGQYQGASALSSVRGRKQL